MSHSLFSRFTSAFLLPVLFGLPGLGLFGPGLLGESGFAFGEQGLTSPKVEPLDEQEEFTAAQIEFFETRVRPLLVEHCYDCHGPDADPPEGGLSLVSRKSIMAGGDSGPGIDLDNLGESNILSAIEYGDLFQMPPDSKLDKNEIATIRKWVLDKAPWPSESDVDVIRNDEFDLQMRKSEHWCWQPVTHPSIPAVENIDWPLDPIDHFILSKLEQANLTPANPANRRTWIRRVTFDITGLPPSPVEIDDFLNDDSGEAFDKVVDRLLDSPRYGERWARHWMDLIRYAETCGHEFDYPIPNAWQYRDYLIRAFNADVAYDQFVVEHIAGDLIATPRLNPDSRINESILGTGFWFLGEATHGPVDVKGDEAGRIDNQIDVMGKTFLGLTIACARCHDHKFDAISAEDYYGVAGFLQSSRRQDVMLDPHQKIRSAFSEADVVSTEVSGAIEDFIASLNEHGQNPKSVAKYMKAAILFLKQDDQWLVADRLVLEGESLKQIRKTGGEARSQGIPGWSGGQQIWWTGANVDDELELQFDVSLASNYSIDVQFTKAPDYGIVQVFINDKRVGEPVDLYASNVERSGELPLGEFELESGIQNIRLKITGKNEKASPHFMAGIDYLVLQPDKSSDNESMPDTTIDTLRKQFHLDRDQLGHWIAAIQDPATADIEHPFYVLRKSAESKIDLESNAAVSFFRDLFGKLNDLESANLNWIDNQSIRLPVLANRSLRQWDNQGFAFGRSITDGQSNDDFALAQFNPVDSMPIWTSNSQLMHSGRLGNRFQGVMRSPTFEITHPHIYYHASAKNASIRLIIDGFRLDVNNALLFNGMKIDVDTDGNWKWIQQSGDLKNHLGHQAFIEIIDQGDGFIGVRDIRVSHQPKPEFRPSKASVVAAVSVDLKRHASLEDEDKNEGRDSGTNESFNPLDRVTESMAIAIQPEHLYSAKDVEVKDVGLFNFMVRHRLIPGAEYDSLEESIFNARSTIDEINQRVPAPILALGMVDGSPEDEYVFIRGNHNNRGPRVPRAPITALRDPSQWKSNLDCSGRFQLAKHMISADHPLTRRVMVNRIWHHLTGQGLVPSVDNFGVLGTKPTHLELLDYLANEFSENDWSVKKLIRRVVLSQTYRMDSFSKIDASNEDPNNDLLYKFRIRRLQGEAIRDAILTVSHELEETMFGPGVPVHLTPFMQGRGRPGSSGPVDGKGRRSIYITVRRNFLSPMMLAFDTPIPFNSIGRRNNSNVPAQALILMNDPFVSDQARKWAERLLEDIPNEGLRLNTAVVCATGRDPTDQELQQLDDFLKALRQDQKLDDLESWSSVCHVLFNTKEFIFIK